MNRMYLLCDDEVQRKAIEAQLGSMFEFFYSGPIGKRPSAIDPSFPLLLDLTGCVESGFGNLIGELDNLVVNADPIAELDELRLSAWKNKVASQLKGEGSRSAGLKQQPNFWVLCASTNGPNTVSEFLSLLPGDTGDSFLLLQHIKDSFIKSLREILMKATGMHVVASTRSERIKPNTVYICPPSRTPRIADGRIFWDKKRSSKFSPCIDESLESLSEGLGHRLKAIVFTGMGNDCLRGCRAVKNAGGSVWAQSTETATMDSMPRCVIEAGLTSEVGGVESLAQSLSEQ